MTPTVRDVSAAAARIASFATVTPLRPSAALTELTGVEVGLKLETEQPTGAFKVRGAANATLRHREAGSLVGLVTASTGNHGVAVAYVARLLGVPAVVCLPEAIPAERAAAVEAQDATVQRCAGDQTAAIRAAQRLADGDGYLLVPPFDHPDVIAGAGTVGLELWRQLPDTGHWDTVVVPVSGGGLAAGVGLAMKSVDPTVRVVGVGAERAPAMKRSLDAGHPVPTEDQPTVATSLMGDLGPDNRHSFRLVRRYVDEVVLVSDDALVDAVQWLAAEEGLAVEPAAAAPVAYARGRPDGLAGRSAALVVTGGPVRAPGVPPGSGTGRP